MICLRLVALRSRCSASRTDTRRATRYSHPTTDPRPANVPALRASARKVAWVASSAAWRSFSTDRHTRWRSGACRHTSNSNAASSRVALNRAISSASLGPVAAGSMPTARRYSRIVGSLMGHLEVGPSHREEARGGRSHTRVSDFHSPHRPLRFHNSPPPIPDSATPHPPRARHPCSAAYQIGRDRVEE